ncbi:MAG: HD domain-containing protein [Mucilaginibacter polytrichastri]|nr:HD domain-containing protein [Mucilaginibacter polytrichastri]
MPAYTELLDKTTAHVKTLFAGHTDDRLVYHNFTHTKRVVSAVQKLGAHYQLSEEDFFIVLAAAWFHDVGYLFSTPENHEEESVKQAKKFYAAENLDAKITDRIGACILATKMPQKPTDLLGKIICDADLFHLGTADFPESSKLMRKEKKLFGCGGMGKKNWQNDNIAFLENVQYHTDYARVLLSKGKEENVEKLRERLEKDSEKDDRDDSRPKNTGEKGSRSILPEYKTEGGKGKKEKPSRGIETMFRTTSTNHLRLSEMADSKANIMISVNSIILSIIISVLLRKLEDNPNLIIPTIIFMVSCLVTIIFSILATRPNVTSGRFSKEAIEKKEANLLFFGNFHQMKLEDYEWGISKVMADNDFLYGSMTRDIYYLGVVLGRKYKMLRIAYNFFMFGFVVSVIAFAIATIFFKGGD